MDLGAISRINTTLCLWSVFATHPLIWQHCASVLVLLPRLGTAVQWYGTVWWWTAQPLNCPFFLDVNPSVDGLCSWRAPALRAAPCCRPSFRACCVQGITDLDLCLLSFFRVCAFACCRGTWWRWYMTRCVVTCPLDNLLYWSTDVALLVLLSCSGGAILAIACADRFRMLHLCHRARPVFDVCRFGAFGDLW